ncbi:MAG: PDZ domain-containing protein, partial [Phototrophicaceae bacterium]
GMLGLALTVWGGVVVQNHMFPAHSPSMLARSQMRLKTMKEAVIRVYDTPPSEGAFVESVEAYSAFDRAGIQPQDVIIRVGSNLTQTPQEVYRALRSVTDLSSVPVNVWRQGEVLNLVIRFQGASAYSKQKTTS